MNFSPFGTFSQTIPGTGMHHFTTAKFAQNIAPGGQVLGVISSGEGGVHYLRPVDNGFNNQSGPQLITLPITVSGKPDSDQPPQTIQIQVVNPNTPTINPNASNSNAPKYVMPIQIQGFPQGAATVLTLAYNQAVPGEPLQLQLQPQIEISTNESEAETNNNNNNTNNNNNNNNSNNNNNNNINNNNNNSSNSNNNTGSCNSNNNSHNNNNSVQTDDNLTLDEKSQDSNVDAYPVAMVANQMVIKNESDVDTKSTQTNSEKCKDSKAEASEEDDGNPENEEFLSSTLTAMPSSWQSLATPGSAVADYLSKIPANTLPLSLHHFLRFSAETIKREQGIESSPLSCDYNESYQNGVEEQIDLEIDVNGKTKKKKRPVKKKPPRPKKPRPGQVHIATALDGTTLFCCPECHMAYPEKELLEQHLVGHKIERRFICDICGAGLKRKEHLERHKLGHNPERPFVCQVCMKGFKRKEHLNLHSVIHSGEKTEICSECGKGFYRKDHLRKHAKSHITKKIKEAAQAQAQTILEAQAQAQAQLAQHTHFSIPIPNMPGVSVIPLNRGVLGGEEETTSAVVSIKTEIEDEELPNLSIQEPQPQVTITTTSPNSENNGVRQNSRVK